MKIDRTLPLASLVVVLSVSVSAFAQSDESLSSARDAFIERNSELEARGDEWTADTTTGDRLRRETAVAATAFYREVEAAIDDGRVPESASEAAWDDAVTVRQIAAALWLEVGECRRAHDELTALLALEPLSSRPVVVRAAESRLAEASACLATDADEAARRGRAGRITGASLIGVGAAAGALGAVMATRAGAAADRAQRERTSDARSLDDYRDHRSDATRARGLATASFIGAGVLAATGAAVWMVASDRDDTSDESASVRLVPAWRAAQLEVRW